MTNVWPNLLMWTRCKLCDACQIARATIETDPEFFFAMDARRLSSPPSRNLNFLQRRRLMIEGWPQFFGGLFLFKPCVQCRVLARKRPPRFRAKNVSTCNHLRRNPPLTIRTWKVRAADPFRVHRTPKHSNPATGDISSAPWRSCFPPSRNDGSLPALKRRGHSHTEVPAGGPGTWT